LGFLAVATAYLADTPPVITERSTVYQHIRPFTDNNSAVVCYHLNHVGVNVTKLSERVQLELGVSVEIYAEISPENLTTRLCVVLPKDIVSNRGILLARNETITRHRNFEAELFHLGLIRSRIEAAITQTSIST
jgi:translation elongation factor EF-Tu-like GTPase